MSKRMTKDERKQAALKVGLKLAKKAGLDGVSVAMVAAEMECSAPLLFHIFSTREKFTKALKAAEKASLAPVVAKKAVAPAPVKAKVGVKNTPKPVAPAAKEAPIKHAAKAAGPVKIIKPKASKFAPMAAPAGAQ